MKLSSIRRGLMMNQGGGKRLPDGFQEVEYIESTGTQYIDTLAPCNQIGIIEMKGNFEISNTGQWKLDGLGDTSENVYIGKSRQNKIAFGNGGDITTSISSLDYINSNSIFNLNYLTGEYKIDGTIIANFSPILSSMSYSYIIFAARSTYIPSFGASYFQSSQKYTYKLYDRNGELLRDLVPCYCTEPKTDVKGRTCASETIGFYDIVNNNFYTNDGSGTFTKGADVN